MSLFDFFFPQQAQAMHLRTLAEQNQAPVYRTPAAAAENPRQKMHIGWLNDDVGTLALTCESLIRMGESKGLFTRAELYEIMKQVDMEDGVADGKLGINKMSQPEKPIPKPWQRNQERA